jgi:hypothetical protein
MTRLMHKLLVVPFCLASLARCERHEDQKDQTRVDLTSVDFSDQDEAATIAMGPLMDDLDRRLFQLFEKTKTPECRETIAEHYGYFTKAFGLEKPLPFSEIEMFNNTCEDERPWDFNNLPEGVVRILHHCVVNGRNACPPVRPTLIQINFAAFLFSTWESCKIARTNRLETKQSTFRRMRWFCAMEF